MPYNFIVIGNSGVKFYVFINSGLMFKIGRNREKLEVTLLKGFVMHVADGIFLLYLYKR